MQSGHITKPSDWAAVVMLATDMGKPITATALSNALRTNTEALKLGVPSKQLLHAAYIEHTKKNAYPNWSRKNTERRAILQDCRVNFRHNASFRVKETVKEMAKTLYQILYSFRFIFPSILSYIPLHHRKALIDDAFFIYSV